LIAILKKQPVKLKQFDLIIIGGGIAGLWTLCEARARGINAILFEKDQLGAGQTLCSQGIIHGGSKYALQAKVTQATSTISAMPKRWLEAFKGNGNIDLSKATLLAEKQYLIPSASIDSKLLSFFGSKTMASHSKRVSVKNAPEAYQTLNLQGSIFELNEPIFDIASVLSQLALQAEGSIYQAEIKAEQIRESADAVEIKFNDETINAKKLLIAAGEGFSELNSAASKQQMQLRPLHMVVAQSTKLNPIYAHFIGRSAKPLLTITSHPAKNGEGFYWYLGGGLAEDGVNLSAGEQQEKAKKLLNKLLPGFEFGGLSLSSFFINRAEPLQQGLLRPDDAYVQSFGNTLIGWPTKLALAPRFAEKALAECGFTDNSNNVTTNTIDTANPTVLNLPKPSIANYPWSD
jgi:glycine/D-amino acid oxidase-like deaminating enzyme